MKTNREKGFILVLVIAILAAIAAVMFLIADDANTMLFQSDTAHLRAAQRNLTASALVWARHNVGNETPETLNKPITLDTTTLSTRPATLTITINARETAKPQAQITTSTTRKRRTLKSQDKYTLAP
jgi:hypothetical protein